MGPISLKKNTARLAQVLRTRYRGSRLIAGIAGPPGSGKSALAEAIVDNLNASQSGLAAVLPMDGFHYDDAVLAELGRLSRKGAIDTFDAGGFINLVRRLKENTEETIAVPVFDRSIEIARAGGRLIPRSTGIIVAEGNYLLIRHPPWSQLAPLLDLAVFLDTDAEALRRRLTNRWKTLGLSPADIERKLREVDLPNRRFVIEQSVAAERVSN
jgi:pantothenate kinase